MIKYADRLGRLADNFFANLANLDKNRKIKGSGAGSDSSTVYLSAKKFDFTKGNPDLPPPLIAREVASKQLLMENGHGYCPHQGHANLRAEVANFYRRFYQLSIDPETEIIITAGAKEALWLLALALLDETKQLAVSEISYPLYRKFGDIFAAGVSEYSLTSTAARELMVGQLPSKFDLLFVTDPHMPLGQRLASNSVEIICEKVQDLQAALVYDAPYGMLFSGRPRSIFHVDREKAFSFEVGTASKMFNMAGWRVGWIVAHPLHIQQLLKMKAYLDNGIFAPLQEGVAASLPLLDGDVWAEQLRTNYLQRRTAMEQLFQLLGLNYQAQEGMFLWGTMKEQHPYGNNDQEWVEYLAQETGILLTPGSVYGAKGKGAVRAALTSALVEIEQAYTTARNCERLHSGKGIK